MTELIDPSGDTTNYAFDADGNTIGMTQVLGTLTTSAVYSYNQAGQMTEVIDQDDRTDSYTYNADGLVLTEVCYNDLGSAVETMSYTYDTAGNMLTALNTDGGAFVSWIEEGEKSSSAMVRLVSPAGVAGPRK